MATPFVVGRGRMCLVDKGCMNVKLKEKRIEGKRKWRKKTRAKESAGVLRVMVREKESRRTTSHVARFFYLFA